MQSQKKRKTLEFDRNSSRYRDAGRFNVELSSPIDGRPAVLWAHGSTPDRIIEFWPDKEQTGRAHKYSFDVIRKYVVYDRPRPQIRAVLLFGATEEKGGEDVQAILGRRLEWDGPQGKAEIKKALGLVDEIARIERRGRPRGKGHTKRKLKPTENPSQKRFYDMLKSHDFTETEMKVIRAYLRHECHQAKTAAELGVSRRAISQAIASIDAKFQVINPKFSLRSYRKLPQQTGSGQRRGGRPTKTDESGISYVQDISQDIERRR